LGLAFAICFSRCWHNYLCEKKRFCFSRSLGVPITRSLPFVSSVVNGLVPDPGDPGDDGDDGFVAQALLPVHPKKLVERRRPRLRP